MSSTTPPSPVAAQASPSEKGLAHKTMRGMYWALTSIALSQGASILSQLILGYKLTSEFGLNMVAVAAIATIGTLRDAGLRKIVIVRGAEYATLAHPVFVLGLIVNFLAAILLSGAAPWLAYHGFQEPQPRLMPMLWITAASFIISSFGVMQSAKLAIDMRFKAIAAQAVASGVIRQMSQAVFALLGFGELSFALPLILVAVFDAISFRWLAGSVPRGGRLTWPLVRELFRDSKWIMLTVLGMTLTYRADGFIVARFEDFDTVVAFYGWAVMLTFQVLQPFTHAVFSIVLPVYSRIKLDLPRLSQAFLRMIGVVALVAVPAVIAICMLVPFVIHKMPLWNGKWDPAIPLVVLFLVSTPFRSLQACAIALDESRGRFDRSARLNLLDGVTTLLAVGIGVHLGGLIVIGVAVALQRSIVGLMHCLISGSKAGLSVSSQLRRILPPVGLGVLIAVGIFALRYWNHDAVSIPTLAILAAPAVGAYLALSFLFMRSRWKDVLSVVFPGRG